MTPTPTPCRVVLVHIDRHPYPAIVTAVASDGALELVAFSARWPITAARAFTGVRHVDEMPEPRTTGEPRWQWPTAAPTSSSEVSRELAREQAAFTRSLAAMGERVAALESAAHRTGAVCEDLPQGFHKIAERVAALEAVAHPPARNAADADDVEAALATLEARVKVLELAPEWVGTTPP